MNNSEQYRRECEARHVLKMRHGQRQEYYKGVLANRGKEATDYLIAEVNRQYKLMNREKELEI